jgi:hypothetical protein
MTKNISLRLICYNSLYHRQYIENYVKNKRKYLISSKERLTHEHLFIDNVGLNKTVNSKS